MKAVCPLDDADIDCLYPIALQFYRAKEAPREIVEILRIGEMFDIQKEDNSHRPIQITGCWRRVLDKGLMVPNGPQWKQHLAPLQYAICESGGCEKIYTTISACFQVKQEGYCALFWDVINAFNSCNRLFLMLCKKLIRMSPYMNLWYSGAAPICFKLGNGKIIIMYSSQGTIQGSPLGGVCFCFGFDVILKDT
jgi:hypothetical protein